MSNNGDKGLILLVTPILMSCVSRINVWRLCRGKRLSNDSYKTCPHNDRLQLRRYFCRLVNEKNSRYHDWINRIIRHSAMILWEMALQRR
jgi:hypothetical protein